MREGGQPLWLPSFLCVIKLGSSEICIIFASQNGEV